MVLHSWLDGFCKSHGEPGSQETLSHQNEHLSGLEGTNCLCVALCAFLFIPTVLSHASSGALGASSLGTLAVWRGLCFH